MLFDFRAELGKITPKIAEGAMIYVFGAGANWGNICKLYRYLINIDINEQIDGFIDNDTNKQGTLFHGKTVLALSEIDVNNSIILISTLSLRIVEEIILQLNKVGMQFLHSIFDSGYFTTLIMQWEYERLLQFKNKHIGERCFIVGNGPSLKVSDLEMIKNEITFATNTAYRIINDTAWRPSYYVIADPERIAHGHKQIKKINCLRFYAMNFIFDIEDFALSGDYFYHIDFSCVWQPAEHREMKFSENLLMLGWGATTTYDCIQLAAYMGFKEIILIGIDNNYSMMVNHKGELIKNDTADYFDSKTKNGIYMPKIDIMNAAYRSAREYAEQHGIKIYNATRGGKLEVFERVDFDSLF